MTTPAGNEILERRTLSDQVYDLLKVRLIDKDLAPGSKVTIDKVGRELGVSPTPVREALAALEMEGLVTKVPLVGYLVAPPLDRTGFEHLFEARLVIEPTAARMAAIRADESALEAIDRAARASEYHETPGRKPESLQLAQADADFHSLLLTTAGNPMLTDWFERMHAHVHLYRLKFDMRNESAALLEHHDIAAAIRARDPEGAERAMVDHLTAARNRLASVFDTD